MAINYEPNALDGIGRGLEGLFAGIVQRRDAERNRQIQIQDQLVADPARLEAMSLIAQNVAEAGGDPLDFLARNFDIAPEQAQGILGARFQSAEEQAGRSIAGDQGAVDNVRAAMTTGTEAETASNVATTRSAQVSEETDSARLSLDIPDLVANMETGQARAAISEAGYQEEYFNTLVENKGGEAAAIAEIAKIEDGMDQLNLNADARNKYRAFVGQMSPEMQGMAGTFLTNPNFGNYLAQLENASAQMRLQRLRNAGDPYEAAAAQFALWNDVTQAQQQLEGELQELKPGDPQSDVIAQQLESLGQMTETFVRGNLLGTDTSIAGAEAGDVGFIRWLLPGADSPEWQVTTQNLPTPVQAAAERSMFRLSNSDDHVADFREAMRDERIQNNPVARQGLIEAFTFINDQYQTLTSDRAAQEAAALQKSENIARLIDDLKARNGGPNINAAGN